MAFFRIETEIDPKSGKVFAELFYPDEAEQPIVQLSRSFRVMKLQKNK